MEITPANLAPLFHSFEMVFQRGFTMPPTYWAKVASEAPSGSRYNIYPFLGHTTRFREWVGERVAQSLEAHAYSIVNKDWEDTVAVERNAIEDDQFSVYTPMFQQLGWDSAVHPDSLLFSLIKKATTNADAGSPPNDTLCYDGKTFFSANHPVGLAGATSATANIDSTGSGPFWYLLSTARPIRPFIVQKRREYTMTRMNALTDEAVFMEKQFRFGVDARLNVGFGLWQLCYASNLDLSNPANYGKARAAMRKIKTDGGLPFGALMGKPTLLVPSDLEEVGLQLLNTDFMVGTGDSAAVSTSNKWKGSADLVVSEYLD